MVFLYSGNKENGITEKDGEKKETSAEKRKRIIFSVENDKKKTKYSQDSTVLISSSLLIFAIQQLACITCGERTNIKSINQSAFFWDLILPVMDAIIYMLDLKESRL